MNTLRIGQAYRTGEAVDATTEPTRAPPAESEAGVVAAGVYAGGRRIKDIPIEEAGVVVPAFEDSGPPRSGLRKDVQRVSLS